jgi:hypothetical protein
MTSCIACIIEGEGEKDAVPVLVGRILRWLHPKKRFKVIVGAKLPRGQLQDSQQLTKAVDAAAVRAGANGAVLVVADADDDPACQFGPGLAACAKQARIDRRVAVVLADVEYETWFIHAARSLADKHGFTSGMRPATAPEQIRDAKGWLSQHRRPLRPYHPPTDQVALTQIMSLKQARASDSFDKLCREIHFLATGKRQIKRKHR